MAFEERSIFGMVFDFVWSTMFSVIPAALITALLFAVGVFLGYIFVESDEPIPRALADAAHTEEVAEATRIGFVQDSDATIDLRPHAHFTTTIEVRAGDCLALIASSWGGRPVGSVSIAPETADRTDLDEALSADRYFQGLAGHTQWCADRAQRVALIARLEQAQHTRTQHATQLHWTLLRGALPTRNADGQLTRGWTLRN